MISLEELIGKGLRLREEQEPPKYSIYCDMDGVLTDFDTQFEHYSGMGTKEYENKYGTAAFWELIDIKIGLKFWSQMPWMPQGKKLWKFIAPFNPSILTSPSRENTSRLGKNTWVDKNLPTSPEVIFSWDKARYANEKAILIDDRPSNIQKWSAAGGIGLECINGNIAPILTELKKLGYYE